MYNRYIPNGNTYTRVTVEDEPRQSQTHQGQPAAPPPPQQERAQSAQGQHSSNKGNYTRVNGGTQGQGGYSGNFFSGAGLLDGLKLGKLGELFDRDKSGGLGSLLGALGLEDMDSGDILLLLIILFLLSEGDNLDLVITLGLMLLLGLSDKKGKGPDGEKPSGPWDFGQGEP